jgi:pimeloyl-ACP methyl ester carboxylesterase
MPNSSVPGEFVSIRGVRIHYTDVRPSTDSGPTLLLVHGFGASLETWYDIAPALSKRVRLVRLDLKGFGLSDKPRDANYTLDEQAEIVAEFVDRLALSRLVICGHSYGGAVAFLALTKLRERMAPGRLVGLILIDAASYAQRLPFFVSNLRNPVMRFLAENFTTPEWRVRYVLNRIFVDKSRVDDARVDRYARFLRLPNAQYAIAKVAEQVVPPNTDEVSGHLKTIGLPTLVIWGASDPTIPVAFAHRLKNDIASARLLILPNVGHIPHEEKPIETTAAILEFLEGLKIRDDVALRLFRSGSHPVLRGTAYVRHDRSAYLWTRGFMPRMRTYVGREVPRPLAIDVDKGDARIETVLGDIMALTKLNYISCRLGDGLPVTLRFANHVGEILTAGPTAPDNPLPFKHYI